MAHRDAVAIGQTNFVACGYLLAINSGKVLVLVVAQHGFLCAIGEGGDADGAMLAAHVAVGGLYLHGGFRGRAFSADDVSSFFQGVGDTAKHQFGMEAGFG